MIRAFVAIELTDDLRAAIARVQAQLRDELARELRRTVPDARLQWVRPESIHLTLKFLGDIREEQVAGIEQGLALAVGGQPAFSVEVGTLGVFPDVRAPRILWVGLRSPDGHSTESTAGGPLARLAVAVESALTALDFAPEGRPFNPHLTLARIKGRGREVGRAFAATGLLAKGGTLGCLPVRAVSLMKSDLRPSGAVYTQLLRVPLRVSG